MTHQMAPKRMGHTATQDAPTIEQQIREIAQAAQNNAMSYIQRVEERLEARLDEREPRRWGAQLRRQEAADYLGVSPITLDRLTREGYIPAYTPLGMTGRAWRREDLDAYIAESAGA